MLLQAQGLTKSFPGTLALDGVNFELAAGEVHALLGENGAGKSTLIKCLTGAYRRNGGDIILDGRSVSPQSTQEAQELGVGTVYQEVNLLPNLTVAENLTLGRQPRRFGLVSGRRMRSLAREMLAGYGLDIDVDRDLSAYSVAVQQIIAIARAVHLSGKVLILDEPTASLDAREVAVLFDVVRSLRERGLGIVFVSHFLDQVFAISDRITVLRNGRHIATEETASLDRVRLINLMLGRELEELEARGRGTRSSGIELLGIQGLGRRGRIAPFDLSVRRGEVIGMAGLLGSGRTETAEVLFGATAADNGAVKDGNGTVDVSSPARAIAAGFGFAPEDRKTDGIIGDLTVRENIALALQAHRGWARPIPRAEQKRLAEDFIRKLDIRTPARRSRWGSCRGATSKKLFWPAGSP
jgi:simple sugar transport system ATP-binding protein